MKDFETLIDYTFTHDTASFNNLRPNQHPKLFLWNGNEQFVFRTCYIAIVYIAIKTVTH
jgi:hypothetical protein